MVLREILEAAGHRVVEAPDGEAGVRLYRERLPDLVTTNIYMPEKDGIETIKELKQDFPDAKIIAISGSDLKGRFSLLSVAREFGAQRALSKPFARDEILKAVNELLGE